MKTKLFSKKSDLRGIFSSPPAKKITFWGTSNERTIRALSKRMSPYNATLVNLAWHAAKSGPSTHQNKDVEDLLLDFAQAVAKNESIAILSLAGGRARRPPKRFVTWASMNSPRQLSPRNRRLLLESAKSAVRKWHKLPSSLFILTDRVVVWRPIYDNDGRTVVADVEIGRW